MLISNQNPCQPVIVSFGGDVLPGCSITFNSKTYYIAGGTNMYFSMYPGGAYMPVSWTTPPPAGGRFTLVKIADPGALWANFVAIPCLGSSTFGVQPGCGVQASSSWIYPGLNVVKVY